MASEHPNVVNTTTQPNIVREHSASPLDPLISHVGDGIFLQTKTAQGLAGIFVWIALFLTCQQVSSTLKHVQSFILMLQHKFIVYKNDF